MKEEKHITGTDDDSMQWTEKYDSPNSQHLGPQNNHTHRQESLLP